MSLFAPAQAAPALADDAVSAAGALAAPLAMMKLGMEIATSGRDPIQQLQESLGKAILTVGGLDELRREIGPQFTVAP